ncbi:MAG: putative Integrase-like domain [Vampirovibrio sp.]|jgi:integrase/recombinase XerD|nr:putative Integrase-like domain [Vampirovibrio sp.]
MSQGKQAKILSEGQVKAALAYLDGTRYPLRDRVLFLLTIKAGLRAKEASMLTWAMVTDPEGGIADCISLPDKASKRKSGRVIPINKELRLALIELKDATEPSPEGHIIFSERSDRMTANSIVMWFNRLFTALGFDGCSSHSGRRTFITNAARKVSLVGGSLRDVQQLAGHSSLHTTQRYVEGDTEAKRKLVNLL